MGGRPSIAEQLADQRCAPQAVGVGRLRSSEASEADGLRQSAASAASGRSILADIRHRVFSLPIGSIGPSAKRPSTDLLRRLRQSRAKIDAAGKPTRNSSFLILVTASAAQGEAGKCQAR